MKNIDSIVHDLKVIGEYFEEQSGAIPTCIPDAVEILEGLKKLVEVTE